MKAALLFAVALLLLSPAHAVFTPIKFPHSIYGKAYIGGLPAPAGTTVSCYINGAQHLSGSQSGATPDASVLAGGSYIVNVGGDDGTLPKEGGLNGDTITFAINGEMALQTATFSSGATTKLDIYIGAPPPAANPSNPPSDSPGDSPSQTLPNSSSLPPGNASLPPAPPANNSSSFTAGNNSSQLGQNNETVSPFSPPAQDNNESNSSQEGTLSALGGIRDFFAPANSSNGSSGFQLSRKKLLAAAGIGGIAILFLAFLVVALFFVWKKFLQGKGL